MPSRLGDRTLLPHADRSFGDLSALSRVLILHPSTYIPYGDLELLFRSTIASDWIFGEKASL